MTADYRIYAALQQNEPRHLMLGIERSINAAARHRGYGAMTRIMSLAAERASAKRDASDALAKAVNHAGEGRPS